MSKQASSKGSHRTEGHCHLSVKSHQPCYSWSDESLSVTQSGKGAVSFFLLLLLFLSSPLGNFIYPCASTLLSLVAFVQAFSCSGIIIDNYILNSTNFYSLVLINIYFIKISFLFLCPTPPLCLHSTVLQCRTCAA